MLDAVRDEKWKMFTVIYLPLNDTGRVQRTNSTASLAVGALRLNSRPCSQAVYSRATRYCFDHSEVARTTIYELSLLAQADFFIGTFSSNIGRLAYQLMFIQKGYRPFVTLDIPWCSYRSTKLYPVKGGGLQKFGC